MRVLLTVMSLAAVVAGSAGGAIGGSDKAQLDDGLLTRSGIGEGEMNAVVGGKLLLDPVRGCILLSGKPVVWPAGTTVTTDPSRLHLPGDLSAKWGDSISGGGGEVPAASIRDTALKIDGDLSALDCGASDTQVIVFTARGEGMTVSP